MATLTSAQLADRVLEALGAKAAGEPASANDAARALEAVVSMYAKLRAEGLAPYAASAFPEEAQSEVIHMTALELIPTFGTGQEQAQKIAALAGKARMELTRQYGGRRKQVVTPFCPY